MMSYYKTAQSPNDLVGYAKSILALMDQVLQGNFLETRERVSIMELSHEARWLRAMLLTVKAGIPQ